MRLKSLVRTNQTYATHTHTHINVYCYINSSMCLYQGLILFLRILDYWTRTHTCIRTFDTLETIQKVYAKCTKSTGKHGAKSRLLNFKWWKPTNAWHVSWLNSDSLNENSKQAQTQTKQNKKLCIELNEVHDVQGTSITWKKAMKNAQKRRVSTIWHNEFHDK